VDENRVPRGDKTLHRKVLTEEQKSDPFKYFHNMTHDFVYDKVRYQYIATYLSSIKKKGNGKFRSISDYRKYHDALQFGSRQQKVCFQKDFRPGMQDLLEAYRKEYKREEQKGVEKTDSDPISRPLYLLLLTGL
jgi:hypothetical protein